MLILVTDQCCTRCDVVKEILKNESIDFEYMYFAKLEEELKKDLLKQANALPIIYDPETKKVLELNDVIA